ncbi:MAG TPA: serine hydrolase domain-containing protein [Candidatus Dormibacteraeota bacterium]|nr:serine hydrolase domain-containing protein [Candidatus Dormibacteraeota bacterium]
MTTIPSLSAAALDRLHQAMAARVASGELPGIVTLIARGNEVHVDTIGMMAFGSDEPMRRDTTFRIASLTKPILAVATMMLVEDGTLALDEPVDRLLPELANRRVLRHVDGPLDDTVAADRPITVEDLLTFRMGHGMLIEPTFDPPFPIVRAANELQLVLGPPDPRTPHDPDRWVERFGTLPLMHQPGERWQYNTGSLVLGVLVARAAGQPLGAFFGTRIFEPLGMADTGFSLSAEQAHRLPSQYTTNFQTGGVELQPLTGPDVWTRPPTFPSGAGGLLSTADDYLAFARLLLNRGLHGDQRLLSERSVEMMTTNHLTPEQVAGGGLLLSGSGWGLGMAVTVSPDQVSPVPGRYGWSGGYGTTWFNDPHRRLIAIALTQTDAFLFKGGLAEFDELAAQA